MSVQILPANINFTLLTGTAILKGADWYIDVSIADRNGDAEEAVNLTDFVGTCHIRETANSDVVVAQPIVAIEDPANGEFSLSLTEIETAAIATSGSTYKDRTKYQYDVVLDNPLTGETYRVLHGYVEVSPQITKEV